MIWMLLALTLLSAQPRDVERARTLANKRVRAERKAEVPVPPPAPGASSAVQIPVTGSAVDSAGRKYTFTGIVTLTLEDPPAPPVPTIAGVRSAGGTALVTDALGGAQLELVGAGLPTTGTLRLTVGGLTATVRQWTPTMVSFNAPLVAATMTGPVRIYTQVNGNWTLVATGPNLTIKPGTVEVPSLPRVDRFLAADGTAKNDFKINEPLVIEGAGFGSQGDRLLVNWLWVPVKSWSSTRIVTEAGDGGTAEGRKTYLMIQTPAGWFGSNGPLVHYP